MAREAGFDPQAEVKRNKVALAIAALVVVGGAVVLSQRWWTATGPAPGAQQTRAIPVEVAKAEQADVPLRVEALGNVTPVASVALKARVDSEIVGIHFSDGAMVKKGDVLVTLDSRAIKAQIAQAAGNLARDQALLEGAERDMRRYTELVAKNATTQVNLENAKTQVASYAAAIKADAGALENLNVQLTYYTIAAPITGRISAAAVKVGNFVRAADATPIASIIQTAPVYVSFNVPQVHLPDIRQALASETGTVDVTVPGASQHAAGTVTMIENTVDAATGTVTVRATMPNTDELLWPGTLVSVALKIRDEQAVVVPTVAVQVGQQGNYVFVVSDGVAKVQPVKVGRVTGRDSALASGLKGGETIVVDGHLQLTNNARVTVRERKAGS